jgi:hypothetical protein
MSIGARFLSGPALAARTPARLRCRTHHHRETTAYLGCDKTPHPDAEVSRQQLLNSFASSGTATPHPQWPVIVWTPPLQRERH